jgi:hypothetical protein
VTAAVTAELQGARFLLACSALAYTCRNGVCEDVSWHEKYPVSRDELLALCLLETARDEFCKRSPLADPHDPPGLPVTTLVDEHCTSTECETIPDECALE